MNNKSIYNPNSLSLDEVVQYILNTPNPVIIFESRTWVNPEKGTCFFYITNGDMFKHTIINIVKGFYFDITFSIGKNPE